METGTEQNVEIRAWSLLVRPAIIASILKLLIQNGCNLAVISSK